MFESSDVTIILVLLAVIVGLVSYVMAQTRADRVTLPTTVTELPTEIIPTSDDDVTELPTEVLSVVQKDKIHAPAIYSFDKMDLSSFTEKWEKISGQSYNEADAWCIFNNLEANRELQDRLPEQEGEEHEQKTL